MAVHHYTNAARDDGRGVVVEYTFKAGNEPTYSPGVGADGGDPCEVQIVSVCTADDELPVTLSDAEYERIEEAIAANHVHEDDDYYDPAEWRD